jgi:transposase-like protein
MIRMNTKTPKVQNRSTKDDAIVNALPLACSDEKAAVEFMEKQRWGNKPFCPLCGGFEVYQMRDSKTGERQANFRWRCRDKLCKAQYTVRKGTVLEDSAIPLRHWAFAFWRAATSKKGVSALEIKRQTGLSYKSSLFLLHRIRFAMAEEPQDQLGANGGIVEADETFFGNKNDGTPKGRGAWHKHAVFSIVERGGRARSFHVPTVTSKTLKPILLKHVSRDADLMTDDSRPYHHIGQEFARHGSVKHSLGEYARGDIHSNTVEGFFSIFKRGLHGIYHNISEKHLHRYLAEFDFRYSNRELSDGQRTVLAIKGAEGKRLTYKEPLQKKVLAQS